MANRDAFRSVSASPTSESTWPRELGLFHSTMASQQSIPHDASAASFQNNIGTKSSHYKKVLYHQDVSEPAKFSPRSQALGRTWWQRIGYWGLSVLTAGTITSLLSCAMLLYFWQGAEAVQNRNAPKSWTTVALNGWGPQVATICSAAIRVSVGFQICVAAAAMAATMLETTGVRFQDIATVSIEKAVASSPYSILPAALRQFSGKKTDRWAALNCVLALAASTIVLISAFTSTILLSDFSTSRVPGHNLTNQVKVGFTSERLRAQHSNGGSHWKGRPEANWRFAESRQEEPFVKDGIAHSGRISRALLPFTSSERRTSLEYYSGVAFVTDRPTWCISPDLSNLTLEYIEGSQYGPESGTFLNAMVKAEFDQPWFAQNFPGISEDGATRDISHCILNTPHHGDGAGTWPLSLCLEWAERTMKFYHLSNSDDFLPALLVNSSLTSDTNIGELAGLRTEKQGPWTSIIGGKGQQVVQASLCFIPSEDSEASIVSMSGHGILSETNVTWNRLMDPDSNSRILRQLGVGIDPQDLDTRGLLSLQVYEKIGNKSTGAFTDMRQVLEETSTHRGWGLMDGNWTDSRPLYGAHAAHASVFQGVIQETLNPALAIDALLFRFQQMLFYDRLQYFDWEEAVTTAHSTAALIPVRWTGLLVLLGVMGVHFLVISVTIVVFVWRTRLSTLGDSWQAVAQMVSPSTREIIETADRMRDKEVAVWVKSTGLDVGAYELTASADERVEIGLKLRSRDA